MTYADRRLAAVEALGIFALFLVPAWVGAGGNATALPETVPMIPFYQAKLPDLSGAVAERVAGHLGPGLDYRVDVRQRVLMNPEVERLADRLYSLAMDIGYTGACIPPILPASALLTLEVACARELLFLFNPGAVINDLVFIRSGTADAKTIYVLDVIPNFRYPIVETVFTLLTVNRIRAARLTSGGPPVRRHVFQIARELFDPFGERQAGLPGIRWRENLLHVVWFVPDAEIAGAAADLLKGSGHIRDLDLATRYPVEFDAAEKALADTLAVIARTPVDLLEAESMLKVLLEKAQHLADGGDGESWLEKSAAVGQLMAEWNITNFRARAAGLVIRLR